MTFMDLEYLSLTDSVQEFKKIMLPQLDLRVEARNLTRFRRDFSGDDTVEFPLVSFYLFFIFRLTLIQSLCMSLPMIKYLSKVLCMESR